MLQNSRFFGANSRLARQRTAMAQAVASTDRVQHPHIKSGVDFLRPHLLKVAPYTPIEPFEVLAARYGRTPQQIVKLDANENPYGPPPEVSEALGSMAFPHIYPDPATRQLRQRLAEINDIPMEHLLVGCGADELIDLLMRCVLEPGDKIIDSPPTFTMYVFDADINDARAVTVPRLDGFRIDVEGISKAVQEHKPKIVFLTSPNNPDGGMITEEELLAVLAMPVLVVLDEAYIEFSTEQSRITWVKRHPNLVVLRTFSKSAGIPSYWVDALEALVIALPTRAFRIVLLIFIQLNNSSFWCLNLA